MKKLFLFLFLLLSVNAVLTAQSDTTSFPQPPQKPVQQVDTIPTPQPPQKPITVIGFDTFTKRMVAFYGMETTIHYYSLTASNIHPYEVHYTEQDIERMMSGDFLPFEDVQIKLTNIFSHLL